ncbi:MAG: hypothetical protein LBO62_00265 [Endomicrobium sp.]|jgi:hypothetical protein|nr:hypothetical protein [Endomicrobium sp.]
MSVFEAVMIIAFGCAWPASIYKSYTSKSNAGKSLWFLIIVVVGYICGIIHKLIYSYDAVLVLYIINLLMVLTDICIYFRNEKILRKNENGKERFL